MQLNSCLTLIGVYFERIILDGLLFWRRLRFANSIIDFFFSLKGSKHKGTLYIRNVTLLLRFIVTKGRMNFKIVF